VVPIGSRGGKGGFGTGVPSATRGRVGGAVPVFPIGTQDGREGLGPGIPIGNRQV
jgi:hypothetical protein